MLKLCSIYNGLELLMHVIEVSISELNCDDTFTKLTLSPLAKIM